MTRNTLEVLFTPAEFAALAARRPDRATCVVFDILRATSTMVMALANGAESILPVVDIPQALAARAQNSGALLAGEREGLRITAARTGGVDFDLGNSPREFTPQVVRERTLIMTTTNGTRALQACAAARNVYPASFLNLAATARRLRTARPDELILVCSGTGEQAALEDTLAAGALCDLVWDDFTDASDSARMARDIYRAHERDLTGAMGQARNGRRLLGIPDLAPDVAFCLQRDTVDLVATMDRDGRVKVLR
ncbi:MAG TPA: 2-phosphosulfolactate phosphatase [Verrucomicrobiae bacterium]|nr:2-phosphosulfolactate phosphatase [Verrucomicrobiae bacterium]